MTRIYLTRSLSFCVLSADYSLCRSFLGVIVHDEHIAVNDILVREDFFAKEIASIYAPACVRMCVCVRMCACVFVCVRVCVFDKRNCGFMMTELPCTIKRRSLAKHRLFALGVIWRRHPVVVRCSSFQSLSSTGDYFVVSSPKMKIRLFQTFSRSTDMAVLLL